MVGSVAGVAPNGLPTLCAPTMLVHMQVVLVGVPGAFLPTCSLKHLPEYIGAAETMRSKGVDLIACISANDAFVMDAWCDHASLRLPSEERVALHCAVRMQHVTAASHLTFNQV
jgi:peroxiredoxin